MGLRDFARKVSHNKSYKETHTEDKFKYYFEKIWVKRGHPSSRMADGQATKTFMIKGKRKGKRTKPGISR